MPRAFEPLESIRINLEGNISRVFSILQNKIIGLLIPGKSLEKLEQRINEVKNKGIVWVSINRFDVMQKHILNKINENLSLVLDIGEVKYVEDYEKQIRLPRWMNYFKKDTNSILVTSREIIETYKKYGFYNDICGYENNIVAIKNCREMPVPNSMMVYMLFFARFKPKKIILFGFDGFGVKTAFKNTPLWNAEEAHCPFKDKAIESYYRKEYVLEERRIGYRNDGLSDLHNNCPTFNDQYRKTYERYIRETGYPRLKIANCSPNSLYTIFRKINYEQLQGELH